MDTDKNDIVKYRMAVLGMLLPSVGDRIVFPSCDDRSSLPFGKAGVFRLVDERNACPQEVSRLTPDGFVIRLDDSRYVNFLELSSSDQEKLVMNAMFTCEDLRLKDRNVMALHHDLEVARLRKGSQIDLCPFEAWAPYGAEFGTFIKRIVCEDGRFYGICSDYIALGDPLRMDLAHVSADVARNISLSLNALRLDDIVGKGNTFKLSEPVEIGYGTAGNRLKVEIVSDTARGAYGKPALWVEGKYMVVEDQLEESVSSNWDEDLSLMCSPEGLRHLADAVQEQKDNMVKDFTMERDLLSFIPSKGDCLLLSSAVPMDDYVTGGRRGVAFDRIVNYDGSHLCLHGEGFAVGFDNLKDYDKGRVYVKAKFGQDENIRLLLPRVRNAVVERALDTSPRAVFDSDSAALVKSYLDLFHKDSHGEVISSLFSDVSFDTRLKGIPHQWIDDVRQECIDLLLGKERQQSSGLRI